MAAEAMLDTLLFVDTNVLLDFYRIRQTDISSKYLEQLEACKDRLIVGSQIEMEYKKNRQRVIVESLNNFTAPDWGKLTVPALVADLQATKMVEKKKKELIAQHKKVNEKIQAVLSNPTHHDPVYQTLQRILECTGSSLASKQGRTDEPAALCWRYPPNARLSAEGAIRPLFRPTLLNDSPAVIPAKAGIQLNQSPGPQLLPG